MRLSGRFDDRDPAGPRCAWPGSAIHLRFEGPALALRLRGSSDHFTLELDGAPLPVLVADPRRERYPVARGLAAGVHELTIVKRTEPLVSEAQLLGLELPDGGELLPPPPSPARRIELVGDSITAGFGVLGDAASGFSAATEDFTLSCGALAARALGAEVVAVAWSGRGVVRNWAGEPGEPMPVLYERTLPARPESRWDHERFEPAVVVVNLGTNDFSPGEPPTEEAFVTAYASFVRRLHTLHPRAPVISALGPMLAGEALRRARSALERAAALLRGEGDRGVVRLEHAPQHAADGLGSDGHPSARTHRRMAAELSAVIRGELGW
jgi:lysophospholipase L1-like esterase